MFGVETGVALKRTGQSRRGSSAKPETPRLRFGGPPPPERSGSLTSRSVLVRAGLLVFGFLTLGMIVLTFISDRGWLAVRGKAGEYEALQNRIQEMEEENAALAGEIESLRFDADAIERRAREELKLARPGEVILVIPSQEDGAEEDGENEEDTKE